MGTRAETFDVFCVPATEPATEPATPVGNGDPRRELRHSTQISRNEHAGSNIRHKSAEMGTRAETFEVFYVPATQAGNGDQLHGEQRRTTTGAETSDTNQQK